MFDVQSVNCSNYVKFHISVAAGRERPVKSDEKLINIEHRIMYSIS